MIENRQANFYFIRCLVRYSGRIDAELELGDRILVIFNDGSGILHALGDGVKAKNWMPSGTTWYWENDKLLIADHEKRGERLEVYIEKVYDERLCEGDMHGKLIKLGSEREMSDYLSEHLDIFGPGYTLIGREYATEVGPIDILLENEAGEPVIVEVKRGRVTGGEVIYQLVRYIDALGQDTRYNTKPIHGILIAPGLARAANHLLEQKGLSFVRFEYPPKSESE